MSRNRQLLTKLLRRNQFKIGSISIPLQLLNQVTAFFGRTGQDSEAEPEEINEVINQGVEDPEDITQPEVEERAPKVQKNNLIEATILEDKPALKSSE